MRVVAVESRRRARHLKMKRVLNGNSLEPPYRQGPECRASDGSGNTQ